MAAKRLLTKIKQVLKTGDFADEDDLVDVSAAEDGSIHVVVVSRKFDGMRFKEKRDLVWNRLMAQLAPNEWCQVSLAITRSPEEIKAM
jgi:acid stress-induced BolA-like protein IbaG/YrbA